MHIWITSEIFVPIPGVFTIMKCFHDYVPQRQWTECLHSVDPNQVINNWKSTTFEEIVCKQIDMFPIKYMAQKIIIIIQQVNDCQLFLTINYKQTSLYYMVSR